MNIKFFYSLLIFALYLFTLRNDVMLESLGGMEGALWVPGGIALAVVYLGGAPMSLVVFVSAFFAHWHFGASIIVAIGLALGASLAAIAGAGVLRAADDFDPSLGRLGAIFWFLLVGLVVCPLVATSVGLFSNGLVGDFNRAKIVELIPIWWAGKSVGILTTAPLLFVFAARPMIKFSWPSAFEAILYAFIFLLISEELFFQMPGPLVVGSGFFRQYYLMFPLVIWVAVRFGPRGGALLVFSLSVVSLASLTAQTSPVAPAMLFDALTGMQMFVMTVTISSLILSAAITQAKTSETKFKSMFYQSGVAKVQLDHDCRFIEVNQKFTEMVGYSREKLLTLTFSDITHPDDRQLDMQRFELMHDRRSDSVHSEKRCIRANGEIIWVTVDATLIPGESVSDSFSLGVIKDITQIKVAEAAQEASTAAAVAANRAKSIFLANMSHEIRTPLGVILGFSDLLKDDGLDSTERARFLETIHRNASQLGRLLDDVLDLSKVEAGHLDVKKEPFSLPILLDELKQTFEVVLQRKGIRFEVNSGNGVPDVIMTDPNRLRQILINIVGNAIKFTSFGSISVELTMLPPNYITKAAKLAISVKDTGCGIAESERSKIFTPFGQASRTITKNFGGTGLGLVLSKHLAGLLGGDVALTASSISEGSTFRVTIDPGTAEQMASQVAPARVSKDPKLPAKPLAGKRILVAEDTPDQAILIQLFLMDQGATVETVANGAQAIEKAAGGQFDAVLMDMQMPVMDGFAATRTLRDLGFRKPILALTAQTMRDDKEKCFKAGCTTHLAKPFTQKVLTDRLLEVLTEDEGLA